MQANRVASVASAIGRPGLTVGIGPSHESIVRSVLGTSYDHPGRSTEEYATILTGLLRGEIVDFDGHDWSVHSAGRMVPTEYQVPVLISALGPRLLRVAGEIADGTVLWMAPLRAVGEHIAPRLHAAAATAGRPTPRIVAGLPIAVHDDVAEARAAQAAYASAYVEMPNYQRVLELGGASTPGDAAIVGDEAAVERQLQSLLDAGATDIWAAIYPVGDDKKASIRRTRELLMGLADGPPGARSSA
jgi:F420-dependent oxidoreductase-like protein